MAAAIRVPIREPARAGGSWVALGRRVVGHSGHTSCAEWTVPQKWWSANSTRRASCRRGRCSDPVPQRTADRVEGAQLAAGGVGGNWAVAAISVATAAFALYSADAASPEVAMVIVDPLPRSMM